MLSWNNYPLILGFKSEKSQFFILFYRSTFEFTVQLWPCVQRCCKCIFYSSHRWATMAQSREGISSGLYSYFVEQQGLEPTFPHSFSGSVGDQDYFSQWLLQGSSSDSAFTFHSVAVRYNIFCKFVPDYLLSHGHADARPALSFSRQ